MDAPVVLIFHIKYSSNPTIIRSAAVKEYFSKLTTNVEVLYPTQMHNGLLLCKSKRTEEKIWAMRHVFADGSRILLSRLPSHLFQQSKCSIDRQTIQTNEMNALLQQCIPFLHASGGQIQIHAEGSALLEGHVFVLNSIHSFLLNRILKKQLLQKSSESFDLRSGSLVARVMTGKLIEQDVESIMIPLSDRYRIHPAFDQQLQSFGGTALSTHLKDMSTKGTRAHEGEIISFSTRELKIPAKVVIAFIVPRLSNGDDIKSQSTIASFQSKYEQMILRSLQTIDQKGLTSLALPVLEPDVKFTQEKHHANKMAVRAMVCAIRQFSKNPSIRLKRFVIVDHQSQIERISRRVKKYQKVHQPQQQQQQLINSHIDLDDDDTQSFCDIFGVPKIPDVVSSTSESDGEMDSEDYPLPYTSHTRY